MALAPLTTGPHLVPANRLAFTTPVREAGGAGHWITLGHHGDDEEGGGVHVYIGGGSGPGSGTITKGPKGLLGHHIAALASHPSVSKAQHHPVGHEPPGARDHSHYAEAPPNAEPRTANAGPEAAKRPGKPYARLHGADQGTRAEEIGKALGEAQGAAKGVKTKGVDRSHLPTLDDKTPGGEPWRDLIGRATKKEERNGVAHYTSANAHYIVKGGHVYEAYGYPGQNLYDDISHPATGDQAERDLKARQDATVKAAHEAAAAVGGLTDALRAAREKRQGPSFSAPEGAEKIADTAVAHQQAQADLAAHRSKADRNPNPWAPHLSPPVGDAKDRELAEKVTRAQLAHQAVVAQQQGAQQQQQAEGQRAHEKDMVRLKAETAVKPLEGKPVAPAASGRQEPPTAKTEKTLFAQPNYLRDHVATRSEMDLRRDAEGLAGMHQQAVKRQIGMERAGDTTSDAYKANAQHAAMLNKHAAAVNDRLEDSRRKSIAGSESDLRGPERRGGGPHDTLMHDEPVAKPAFSAPGAKEKPQTAPQPAQPASAPAQKTAGQDTPDLGDIMQRLHGLATGSPFGKRPSVTAHDLAHHPRYTQAAQEMGQRAEKVHATPEKGRAAFDKFHREQVMRYLRGPQGVQDKPTPDEADLIRRMHEVAPTYAAHSEHAQQALRLAQARGTVARKYGLDKRSGMQSVEDRKAMDILEHHHAQRYEDTMRAIGGEHNRKIHPEMDAALALLREHMRQRKVRESAGPTRFSTPAAR